MRHPPHASCWSLADRFAEIVHGEAPRELIEAALAHLGECPYCESEFAHLLGPDGLRDEDGHVKMAEIYQSFLSRSRPS